MDLQPIFYPTYRPQTVTRSPTSNPPTGKLTRITSATGSFLASSTDSTYLEDEAEHGVSQRGVQDCPKVDPKCGEVLSKRGEGRPKLLKSTTRKNICTLKADKKGGGCNSEDSTRFNRIFTVATINCSDANRPKIKKVAT